MQDDVCVEKILPLVKDRLYDDQSDLNQAFINIHQSLKQNASEKAADAVVTLLDKSYVTVTPKVTIEDIEPKVND